MPNTKINGQSISYRYVTETEDTWRRQSPGRYLVITPIIDHVYSILKRNLDDVDHDLNAPVICNYDDGELSEHELQNRVESLISKMYESED